MWAKQNLEIIIDKFSSARITRAILQDENAVLPVSVHLEGQYGYHDVCVGSTAVINKNGVSEIIEIPLNEKEQQQMQHSIEQLKEMQDSLIN